MLILDPNKRYTVEQIKRHPWMLEEAPRLLPGTIAEMPAEPNDQVLRFMSSLDINTTRTRQVRFGPFNRQFIPCGSLIVSIMFNVYT